MITDILFDNNYAVFNLPEYSSGTAYTSAISFDSWAIFGQLLVGGERIVVF